MQIKICGLCRVEDAAVAAASGATHGGVIRVPGTVRWRPVATARAVLDGGAGLRRVGVFADADVATVKGEAASLALDVVQLHGAESPGEVEALRGAGLEVWKVVKPADGAALLEAAARYAAADLLLIEGASEHGLGGVGAAFDWDALAGAVDRLPGDVRVGIAGGLTPENVAEAVRRFRPALVDVSSGVEEGVGRKEPELVRAFIRAARGGAPDAGREDRAAGWMGRVGRGTAGSG